MRTLVRLASGSLISLALIAVTSQVAQAGLTSATISPTSQTLAVNDMSANWKVTLSGTGTISARFTYGDGTYTNYSTAGTKYPSHTFAVWCETTLTKTYTQKVIDLTNLNTLKTSTTTLKKSFQGC